LLLFTFAARRGSPLFCCIVKSLIAVPKIRPCHKERFSYFLSFSLILRVFVCVCARSRARASLFLCLSFIFYFIRDGRTAGAPPEVTVVISLFISEYVNIGGTRTIYRYACANPELSYVCVCVCVCVCTRALSRIRVCL